LRLGRRESACRASILKEFRTSVLDKASDGREFIDDILVPLSDAFEIVTRVDYKATAGADEVNNLLAWLKLLDNTDWIPPAISFLSQQGNAEALRHFLADLERLAASMLIRRVDITRRVERYGRVLDTIESGADLYAAGSPLQLEEAERTETLERLRAEVYTVVPVRRYVLLRLDSALSAGGASYDHPLITVEHVLPQSPAEGSTWQAWFTDEQREHWVHRLANLALLTRRKNSEASNYEFSVKKEKYFATQTGVSPFVLTTQLLGQSEWTPELLEKRQNTLVSALGTLWRLV
jgi:hypothetical protein